MHARALAAATTAVLLGFSTVAYAQSTSSGAAAPGIGSAPTPGTQSGAVLNNPFGGTEAQTPSSAAGGTQPRRSTGSTVPPATGTTTGTFGNSIDTNGSNLPAEPTPNPNFDPTLPPDVGTGTAAPRPGSK